MIRWTIFPMFVLFSLALIIGCSGGGGNPITPDTGTLPALTGAAVTTPPEQAPVVKEFKNLWGFFNAYFDTVNGTFEVTPNHTVASIVNTTTFFNNNPSKFTTANLTITPSSPPGTYVDADIDIKLQHPFGGVPKFSGFDVHMALITNQSATMAYDGVEYGVAGTNVMMIDDPINGDGGGPDGFTRWFNPTEFPTPGILGYTEGKIATDGWTGDATINPYKVYADGMTSHEPAYNFIAGEMGDGNNIFASGNIPVARNMYIRFPIGGAPVIKVNYAIIASWDGTQYPDPVNAAAVMAASVVQIEDWATVWYDGVDSGGNLIVDVKLAGYGSQPSTIVVESSVLDAPYTFDSTDMTPVTTGTTYAVYHAQMPASTTLTTTDGHEMWVIAEYGGSNLTISGYQNTYGVTNLAGTDPLASYFKFPVHVLPDEPIPPLTTNIPLRPGVTAWDIAVDHADGDLFILYTDGDVYRATADGGYQDEVLFIDQSQTMFEFIDVTPLSKIIIGGNIAAGSSGLCNVYDESGIYIEQLDSVYGAGTYDVIAYTDSAWPEAVGFTAFTPASGTAFRIRRVPAPLYNTYEWTGASTGYGLGSLHYLAYEACESFPGITYNYFATLEGAPEFEVALWERTTESSNTGCTWISGWGGVQADGMNGFNAPVDITRDSHERIHVLDYTSLSEPVVKKYSSTGGPDGSYGDSTSISEIPRRIEGSDFNDDIFVLHEDLSGNSYISKFSDADQPVDLANFPPNILSGVSGMNNPPQGFDFAYSVVAVDYDSDPLTYSWTVRNSLSAVVDTGTGNPYIVPWNTTIGALAGEVYTVDCDVSDGVNPAVPADTLTVTIGPSSGPGKNVTLRPGVLALDIGIDHADGDLLVLYADDQVWVYTDASGYTVGAPLFTAITAGLFNHIDVAHNSYMIINGNEVSTTEDQHIYNSSGTLVFNGAWSYTGVYDAIAWAGGARLNWLGGWGPSGTTNVYLYSYAPPAYATGYYNYTTGMVGSGPGVLNISALKAVESLAGATADYIALEAAPEFSWERYEVLGIVSSASSVIYKNVRVGGIQADGIAGFNDPRDITRDNSSRIHVLDYTSGNIPVVKKYGLGGGQIGVYGDALSILTTPRRIEGSDFDGDIVVLHDDGVGQSFISIFTNAEQPNVANFAPVVISGVSGPPNPYQGYGETYSVVATDGDADILTYSWTVRDSLSTIVDTGSGNPYFVDWGTIGALTGQTYTVACDVSDGIAPPVAATTLFVTIAGTPPLKNAPLRPGEGVSGLDIAVDHSDGDVLVLFDDGKTYRYPGGVFAGAGMLYNAGHTDFWYIDIGPTGDFIVCGNRTLFGAIDSYGDTVSPTGVEIGTNSHWSTAFEGIWDAFAVTTTQWLGDLGAIGFDDDVGELDDFRMRHYYGATYSSARYIYEDGLISETSFVAGESGNNANTWFMLLGGTINQTRSYTRSAVGASTTPGNLTFITGWGAYNNPRDITRDNLNNIYVLDWTGAAPIIYKTNSSGGSPVSFGNATSIAYDPLRIDGSSFNGDIYVLHEDPSGNAYASRFTAAEIP